MSEDVTGSTGADLAAADPGASLGSDPNATPAAPSVIDLTDDSRIRFDGKETKFSDFRNFQSQYTKASQEAARLRQEIARRDQLAQQQETQRQAEARRQAGQQGKSILDELRTLPYLDGPAAAQLAERIAGDFAARDQVLLAALTKMQQMERIVSQLNDNYVGSSFESKIAQWVKDLGLPSEANEAAKIFYLAHEGEDLDQQFPDMFRAYWEGLQRQFAATNAAKVAAARKQPFIPGRGATAGPTKPLQLDPKASAAQTADALWESLQSTGT
jgi:hypothetical protein